MVTEKKWVAVPPQILSANGGADGKATVPDTSLFKVKQKVKLKSDSIPSLDLQVKRIISPTEMYLGTESSPIHEYANLSALLVSENATVRAEEQNRPAIPPDSYERAVYEEEPVMAKRVVLVDKNGNKYSLDNPLPVNASFTGDLLVKLDGEGVDGDTVGLVGQDGVRVVVNGDGSLLVKDPTLATILSSIFNQLQNGTMKVDDDETQTLLQNISTTLNGLYNQLNNVKERILKAVDRNQLITSVDLGTKDERVVTMDYTAPSVGVGAGFTARKTISYVQTGNRYSVSNIQWSLI